MRTAPIRPFAATTLALFVLFWSLIAGAADRPSQAGIATAHPLATAAGFEMLEAGGNAFDAAVAASAVLAVVEPQSSGIGGGGFWLLHRAKDGKQVMIDGRERAPLAADRDLYIDATGRFDRQLALAGPLAAGIPGEPAALAHIAEHYGRLGLAKALAPAIRLARDGFTLDRRFTARVAMRRGALARWPAGSAQFMPGDKVPIPGTLLAQPDLANTLEHLARDGRDGFYAGPIAERLVSGVRAAGGIWSADDLADYRIVERAPTIARSGDWRIVSASPPSAGGILLIEMINMLGSYELDALSDADRIHLLVEVMRRAYRDRARYLGDPDFIAIPTERLTHPYYAAGLIRDLRFDRAGESLPLEAHDGGGDTTHLSVIDREGNRVAATLSVNHPFGSCFVPPGTGVVLNNEMDDFSAQPGVANAYGLTGGEANAIAPGKRMLSSMTPTFLESDGAVAILGTPGGSRIISMVLRATLALFEGATAAEAVALPRFHHQYLPDVIQFEPEALGPRVRQALEKRGHRLEPLLRRFGNMQIVLWDVKNDSVTAASDPRGLGLAEVRPVAEAEQSQ